MLSPLIGENGSLYFEGEVGTMLTGLKESAGSYWRGQQGWWQQPLGNLYAEARVAPRVLPHLNNLGWQVYSGIDDDRIICISWDHSRGDLGNLPDLLKNIANLRDQCRTSGGGPSQNTPVLI